MLLGARFAAWVKWSLAWVAEMLATRFPTNKIFKERWTKKIRAEFEARYPTQE